jgi:glycosyltransferase involved in cell wall biosynthesis
MAGKIVFINQATGYLTIDIINRFVSDFKEVSLITGSVRVQDTPLNPQVRVETIKRYDRGNNLRKAFSWFVGSLQIFFLLKFRYNKCDKFFFTVPPTAYLLAPLFSGRYSILVYDIYPEALSINGISENGVLYRWWARRNRRIFDHSHRIYTLSENMRSGILRYTSNGNITVIPNWSAFSHLTPVKKEENKILHREGLNGKFIVQYSGNIGVTHNVETLVDVAEILSTEPNVVFQIIGRGERNSEIARKINSANLNNCLLLPFRNDKELFESLCAADIAVIILDERTPDVSIPSKLYNIMSAGRPIMAISSMESGIAKLVANHNIGKAFNKEDTPGMTRFIMELKSNPEQWKHLSDNSLKASRLYTSDNAGIYLRTYKN